MYSRRFFNFQPLRARTIGLALICSLPFLTMTGDNTIIVGCRRNIDAEAVLNQMHPAFDLSAYAVPARFVSGAEQFKRYRGSQKRTSDRLLHDDDP
jgi:hypothetical protein